MTLVIPFLLLHHHQQVKRFHESAFGIVPWEAIRNPELMYLNPRSFKLFHRRQHLHVGGVVTGALGVAPSAMSATAFFQGFGEHKKELCGAVF